MFGVLEVLNMAHASVFMIGAYVALVSVTKLGVGIIPALIISMIATGLLGVILNKVAFMPLRKKSSSHLSPLVTSIGASIVLVNLVRGYFGATIYRFPEGILGSSQFIFGESHIDWLQIITIIVAIVLMGALNLLLKNTKHGKAMRALSENQRTARLLGINVERIFSYTFAISSALGGAAGVLVGLSFNSIFPYMGEGIELKGLAVIILGGLGSIPGAVAGAFVLGFIDIFTIQFIGSSIQNLVSFGLMFLILLIRPSGMFSQSTQKRA